MPNCGCCGDDLSDKEFEELGDKDDPSPSEIYVLVCKECIAFAYQSVYAQCGDEEIK